MEMKFDCIQLLFLLILILLFLVLRLILYWLCHILSLLQFLFHTRLIFPLHFLALHESAAQSYEKLIYTFLIQRQGSMFVQFETQSNWR